MTKHLANWVSHCKQWATDHNLKYSQCLKSSECRQAYKNKHNSTTTEASEQVKPKRKYVRKNKIEEPKELPQEVLNVIQKRKYTRKVKSPEV